MIPNRRISTHPGELLFREFISLMGLDIEGFAQLSSLNLATLNDVVLCRKSVTLVIAERIALATGTRAGFWMNLQDTYDASCREQVRCLLGGEAGVGDDVRQRMTSPVLAMLLREAIYGAIPIALAMHPHPWARFCCGDASFLIGGCEWTFFSDVCELDYTASVDGFGVRLECGQWDEIGGDPLVLLSVDERDVLFELLRSAK